MKRRQISLTILLVLFFFLVVLTPLSLAITYNADFKENDVMIWRCNVCDEEKMEQVFGETWQTHFKLFHNIKAGYKMKWVITGVDNNALKYSGKTKSKVGAISITYEYWMWTENEWEEKPQEDNFFFYKNSSYFNDNLLFANFVPLWFPAPTREYLRSLDTVLYKGYQVDVTYLLTLTCEVNAGDNLGGNPSEYIKVLAIYDSHGILSSYKLYIKNHYVLIDISIDNSFEYQLPVFIILTTAFTVVTIYFYKKV